MKWIIILMVLSLLVIVGCGEAPEPAADAVVDSGDGAIEVSPATTPDEGRTLGTFRDVMSWGRSAHCTWDIRMDVGHMVGEMWIDGDKWKQEITTEGQLINSVGDGEFMYMWGPEFPGMKIPMVLHEGEDAEVPSTGTPAGPEMDIEYNYDCEPMSIPSSMFVPPSGIEFRDIGEMMAAMGR